MRKNIINKYLRLAKLYAKNGFSLYLVGGSARDYILGRDTTDLDLATDALVEQSLVFLTSEYDVKTPFKKFGNVKFKIDDVSVDITTLRKEFEYDDYRHPTKIEFVNSTELDAQRRDFTVNALYLDHSLETIYDYFDGVSDLVAHRLRMVGDPIIKIKEDPLRLLRAVRFSLKLNFQIDEQLSLVIKEFIPLLSKLNPEKVKEEILKMYDISREKADILLESYNIDYKQFL